MSSGSAPGYVRGKHFTAYVDDVKALRRSGQDVDAEMLLKELVAATEEEARAQGRGWGVAPWYYEQLAIIYRARKEYQSEVETLQRFAEQTHANGVMPPTLLKRLTAARKLLHAEK